MQDIGVVQLNFRGKLDGWNENVQSLWTGNEILLNFESFLGNILERNALIEGDVFLHHQRKHHNRAIPLMSTPLKITDRITFKEWLRQVAKLRKGRSSISNISY